MVIKKTLKKYVNSCITRAIFEENWRDCKWIPSFRVNMTKIIVISSRLGRYQAVEFLSKLKKGRYYKFDSNQTITEAAMTTAPEDIRGRIEFMGAINAARIAPEENEIQHSVILWSVVGIGLGIVIGIMIVNIINSLRGRMRRSELSAEEGHNDSPSAPYVRFNTNQQTGMQQFLGNISKFKPKW